MLFFAAIALLALPALAQVVPPTDPGTDELFTQLFQAITNFRTGATLVGLVVTIHLLVTLTKIPAIGDRINSAWRPVIAVFLGVVGGVVGFLASGSPLHSALSLGIPAGITAAGGSVVLHEAAQSVKMAWAWLTRNKVQNIGAPVAALLIGSTMLFSGGARAQQVPSIPLNSTTCPSTKLGGEIGPWVCMAPAVSISVADYNLTKQQFEAAANIGGGYGIDVHQNEFWGFGVHVYANINPAASTGSVSLVLTPFNGYVGLGLRKGLFKDHDWSLPFYAKWSF